MRHAPSNLDWYFNPHSPCGERLGVEAGEAHGVHISIHTPLAGSDRRNRRRCTYPQNFNPHSPCGERLGCRLSMPPISDFNPHSPCGERLDRFICYRDCIDAISIHTPLAGSDSAFSRYCHPVCISIHTPLAGSDLSRSTTYITLRLFQSTLPLRGATTDESHVRSPDAISIHTPLAGSDRENETFLTKC